MNIASLLSSSTAFCKQESTSKKRVLEDISRHVSQAYPHLDADIVFSALISREKLGSTGIGNGIAIPHCRISDCKDITAMLITLQQGIDFDAIDNEKVDVIFVLIVPEDANDNHLRTLASIAEKLSDETILHAIRRAQDTPSLLDALA
ncbi:MAG: PTS system nitrogen regulatory IIA component [Candidatus Endobugula sp.]|jgi:PTS system nitrogen regulatory IIA component